MLLPEGNRRDLKDIPDEVRDAMTIDFTSDVRQNLDAALMSVLLPDTRKRRVIEARASDPRPPLSPPPA